MTAKLKKAASKLACWLVLTRKFISTQSMLTREARKDSRHIDTWAKKHVGTQGTLAHEHVFST